MRREWSTPSTSSRRACPVIHRTLVPSECWEAAACSPSVLPVLAGRRLVAFAGIASPAAFASTLTSTGAVLESLPSSPTINCYSADDIGVLDAAPPREPSTSRPSSPPRRTGVRLRRLRRRDGLSTS